MSPDPAVDPAVDVAGLTMRYGGTLAVDDLTIAVAAGSITAVLGPNGAGKTTTLETCEGFRRPQRGTVRVLGLDPVRQRRELLPRLGVMLQAGGAWTGARAVELLRHAAALYAHPVPVGLLVERLGLADCGRTPYRRLSGGQQQRLALATAVVGRPELLVVDEPTARLDPAARQTTWGLLREMRADGVTVVLTTHDMAEAAELADVVHVLDRGRCVASGAPAELTGRLGEAAVRLVAARPVGSGAAASLGAALGSAYDVSPLGEHGLLVVGPADAATLGAVSAWCGDHGVVPVSVSLSPPTLEDVFLRLTGGALEPATTAGEVA